MKVPGVFGWAKLGTDGTRITERSDMLAFNMIHHIGRYLGLEITVSATIHSFCILVHLWTQQQIKVWNQRPLWYLLLCKCHAFLDGQNLEQMGQVYPDDLTCLLSMWRDMACLSLEVWLQSVHPNLEFPGSRSERGKILLCISSQSAPKEKHIQQDTIFPILYFNSLCDICFYGGARHS